MKRLAVFCVGVCLLTLALSPASQARRLTGSQESLTAQEPEPPQQGERPTPFQRPGQRHEIKPYDKVITKEAKSDQGIFTVHKVAEKYYYEIPKSELGTDYLWVSQIARTTLGVGYGGQAVGNRVVRWERQGDRVLLKHVQFNIVADDNKPIARAVRAANNATIIRAFNIEALGKDDAPVIDVTSLFATEVMEFSARTRLRARGFDPSRSYVESVVSYPQNIEVRATHTFMSPPDISPAQRPPTPPLPFFAAGMRPGSATVLMHFSMIKLPENPMMPRLFDERVGYFSIRKQDYGRDEHRAPQRRYITRWRLEKKDPNADLSEPVKPIVYYVDPATPSQWVPYVKRGVEKWQKAFEEAGFKNAILAREAPSIEEDPEWHPEDARYSVIRWLPSTIENASGPHVHDPRTGEILESDIQFYHNVMNLSRDWYFIQVGALDPRARRLPLPDDLMGTLIEYVVAHEVGHTLGFQHNMKASSLYEPEKVRDREWVKKMSHTPTLMDYSRFNYVAQPEDNIDPADLVPRIGPYDKWATMWGYKPIPGARTPDDEKKTLDKWARQQDEVPWLRFSTAGSRGSDPGELTEAVGDADAVASTGLGMKNLERVSGMLLSATERPGEPFSDLEQLYGRLLGQWAMELTHVTALVGGFHSQQKHGGQNGVRFVPVPGEKQAEAVRFLNQNAFVTPSWLIRPDVLRRIEPSGALDRIRLSQQRVLASLLSSPRVARLIEQEAIDGNKSYRPARFFEDVRNGVWSELSAPRVRVDPFRRNLQRAYLALMADRLNGRLAVADDQRAFIRGELRALNQSVTRAMVRAGDRETRLHLEDARDQIANALDPKFPPPAPTTATFIFPFFESFADTGDMTWLDGADQYICWPDYAIRLPHEVSRRDRVPGT